VSNRAAVLHAAADLRVEDFPMPEPGPRQVLVEVASVGVCGSDVHYYEHGRIGEHVVRAPMVLGHEAMGVVVGRGAQARRHPVGQRVALEPGVPDGTCAQCRAGRYNLCPDVRFFATPPVHGAFARYVTIEEDFAHALPDSVSDDAGALLEPLSVGIWACWRAGLRGGETVLVSGAGPIGQLAMQVAVAFGAAEVVLTDLNPHRLALGRRTGATRTVQVGAEPLEAEADVLLECSGVPAALQAGIGALRPAGRAIAVGMGPEPTAQLPLATIQNREITLTGTFRYAGTYPTAIALAASGRVDLEATVTGRVGLGQTESALRASATDPTAVKTVVLPQV